MTSETPMAELGDPGKASPEDYLRLIEGGETALHLYLKDDKEWWLAHDADGEYPEELDGPWLLWTTYPSGAWKPNSLTRDIMLGNVDGLYYIDHEGDRCHTVHEATAVPVLEAPRFVRRVMRSKRQRGRLCDYCREHKDRTRVQSKGSIICRDCDERGEPLDA